MFLKIHVKFCSNYMLITIQSTNIFLTYNLKLQKLKI